MSVARRFDRRVVALLVAEPPGAVYRFADARRGSGQRKDRANCGHCRLEECQQTPEIGTVEKDQHVADGADCGGVGIRSHSLCRTRGPWSGATSGIPLTSVKKFRVLPTPTDLHLGRGKTIVLEREWSKRTGHPTTTLAASDRSRINLSIQ